MVYAPHVLHGGRVGFEELFLNKSCIFDYRVRAPPADIFAAADPVLLFQANYKQWLCSPIRADYFPILFSSSADNNSAPNIAGFDLYSGQQRRSQVVDLTLFVQIGSSTVPSPPLCKPRLQGLRLPNRVIVTMLAGFRRKHSVTAVVPVNLADFLFKADQPAECAQMSVCNLVLSVDVIGQHTGEGAALIPRLG